jgi:hypothetical protein
MTPHVLNGAIERVKRAEKHLADLGQLINQWLDEQENAVVFKFDSNPPHNLAAIPKPVRRTYHPIHGNVDVKLGLTVTINLDDGTPVTDALEVIKLKVAETLTAFKSEF